MKHMQGIMFFPLRVKPKYGMILSCKQAWMLVFDYVSYVLIPTQRNGNSMQEYKP